MRTIAPVMYRTFVLCCIHSLLIIALLFAHWSATSTLAAPLPRLNQQAETAEQPHPTAENDLLLGVTPMLTATVVADFTAPLTDNSAAYSYRIYLPMAMQGGLFQETRSPTPTLTPALPPTPTGCPPRAVTIAAPNAVSPPCPPATSTPRSTPTLGSPTPTATPTRTPGPTATPRSTPTIGCRSTAAAIPVPGTPTPPPSPCLVVVAAGRNAAIEPITTPRPSELVDLPLIAHDKVPAPVEVPAIK